MSARLPPRPRARRKETRPAEITAAALDLFVERGFAATKLEDVAARAGVGKGTIYLYFPNKVELFRAVLRLGWLPNLEAAEAIVAEHTGSTADLMRKLAAHALRIIDSPMIAIPKLVLAESGNFPAIARLYLEEVGARAIRLFAGVIARGVQRGEFRPLEPTAVVPLFGAPFLLMALLKHSVGRHVALPFDPARVIDTHLEVLLRGLAPEPPP
jgi:AcrR family transcriptional regulator